MDLNFDHQMSLSKSKCWYSKNYLCFFKACCSIVRLKLTKFESDLNSTGTFSTLNKLKRKSTKLYKIGRIHHLLL